ncbi:MAG: hypothetical protein JWN24_1368 [Phycisphaerales bacterium]|nr:hypothetical protein [Phycisphaerales bacterium]
MKSFALQYPTVAAITLAGLIAVGCSHGGNAPETQRAAIQSSQENPGVPEPGQKLFASPEEAAAVLKDAVLTKDRPLLISIFGPEGRQLILTGDRVEENHDLDAFGKRMTEYLRVDHPAANMAVLYVGRENWPFPIPLMTSGGQWFFDTAAGKEELLNRRIGENELGAIAVCRAYVVAQREYARKVRTDDGIMQYAQHFMSTPGKKDGLYWPVAAGEELSPMGPLVAEAREEGYPTTKPANGKPRPYHGYYFRILTAQGDAAPGGRMSYLADGRLTKGFALIASPSKWGASGVMTFIVNQEGKVYQKNLGESTREIVRGVTEYNPDSSWEEVKD